MLLSAVEHYQREQAITATAITRLRRERFGSLETLTRTMIAFQVLAARESVRAIPEMLDEQNLENSSVSVVIDVASIDTNDEKRDEHLRSADFFDVVNFPKITFTSTKVTPKGGDAFEVAGDLTI